MKEYEIFRLRAGKWESYIAPQIGADVVSLQYAERDVLVPLRSKEQLDENPYLHGSPILLPANRTRDGKFSFHDREYTLPINEESTHSHLHGFVHSQPFQVCDHSNTSVTMVYENRGECYPFPFQLTASYSLSADGFSQRYEIRSTADVDFPLTFALHTTFAEPEWFSVPISRCQERDEQLLPTGRLVSLSPLQEKFAEGGASKGVAITGYYLSKGNTARIGDFTYTVSDLFDHWILYNGGGNAGFLCVEPQCGAVDGLNSQTGKLILRAGDTAVFETTISL